MVKRNIGSSCTHLNHPRIMNSNAAIFPTSASVPGEKIVRYVPHELIIISVVHCLDLYIGFIHRATVISYSASLHCRKPVIIQSACSSFQNAESQTHATVQDRRFF